jgi:hypothetical protein
MNGKGVSRAFGPRRPVAGGIVGRIPVRIVRGKTFLSELY